VKLLKAAPFWECFGGWTLAIELRQCHTCNVLCLSHALSTDLTATLHVNLHYSLHLDVRKGSYKIHCTNNHQSFTDSRGFHCCCDFVDGSEEEHLSCERAFKLARQCGKSPPFATLHPDSLDARIFALWIADSSTFHALHCRRAVFEPLRMLVHLCGTLCPFISRTAIWLLQLLCAILSLISFLSTDFVSSVYGVWSHKLAIQIYYYYYYYY